MPETEAWTVGRLLQWTTGYLQEHRSDSPRLDAELLLAHARKCRRIELYTAFEEVPDEATRTAFRELVRRRAEGTPVAYLLGRREFYSLDFHVTPDVLIPRPETEFLLIALLDLIKERFAVAGSLDIVDVGTGSGILAICAARELPAARILAIDASRAALEVARRNAREHHVAGRIEFLESDLLAGGAAGRRFDFVVSNPPYVSTSEMAGLARDVARFEPRQALEAGARGTEVIERLIPQAAEHLKPGGYLLLEISPQLGDPVLELVAADGRFEPGTVINDLAGKTRVVRARRKA